VPESPFGPVLPSHGAVAESLGEFFQAYLTGVGKVERYLSPGARLRAAADAGYVAVRVEEVRSASDRAAGAVPADGTQVQVQVRVVATDAAAGRWPLQYTLTLTARSSRWEVTALEAGAPLEVPKSSPSGSGGAAR
jgi:hypothetical protein